MLKKLFFCGVIIAAAFIGISLPAALAYSPPTVRVEDLSFARNAATLDGSFSLKNYTASTIFGVSYDIILHQGTDATTWQDMDVFMANDQYDLAPHASQNVTFTYSLPKNLMAGDYSVEVQAVFTNGRVLAFAVQPLTIPQNLGAGTEIFLNTAADKLLRGTASLAPEGGAVFDPGTAPNIVVYATNTSTAAVTVIPELFVNPYTTRRMPIVNTKESSVTFASGEQKTLTLQMPALSVPGSYLARVKFIDSAGDAVSNFASFRWVISGNSADILAVMANGTTFAPHTATTVTADYVGPADGSSTRGMVVGDLYDTDGRLIERVIDAPATIGQQPYQASFTFQPKFAVPNPLIRIFVLDSNNQVLASENVYPQSAVQNSTYYFLINASAMFSVVIASFVLLVMMIVWYFVARQRKNLVLVKKILIIILGAFSLAVLVWSVGIWRTAAAYDVLPPVYQEISDYQPPVIAVNQTTLVPTAASVQSFMQSYLDTYYQTLSARTPNWIALTSYTTRTAELNLINNIMSGNIYAALPSSDNSRSAQVKVSQVKVSLVNDSPDMASAQVTYDLSVNGKTIHPDPNATTVYQLVNTGSYWKIASTFY